MLKRLLTTMSLGLGLIACGDKASASSQTNLAGDADDSSLAGTSGESNPMATDTGNRAVPPSTPVDCTTDNDCTAGSRYNGEERWCSAIGTCVQCRHDLDCGESTGSRIVTCSGGQCAERELTACSSASDCDDRSGCVDGYCSTCDADAQCPKGWVCLHSEDVYPLEMWDGTRGLAGCYADEELDPSCLDGTCAGICGLSGADGSYLCFSVESLDEGENEPDACHWGTCAVANRTTCALGDDGACGAGHICHAFTDKPGHLAGGVGTGCTADPPVPCAADRSCPDGYTCKQECWLR